MEKLRFTAVMMYATGTCLKVIAAKYVDNLYLKCTGLPQICELGNMVSQLLSKHSDCEVSFDIASTFFRVIPYALTRLSSYSKSLAGALNCFFCIILMKPLTYRCVY